MVQGTTVAGYGHREEWREVYPGLFGSSSRRDLLCIGNMRTDGAKDDGMVFGLQQLGEDRCTVQ